MKKIKTMKIAWILILFTLFSCHRQSKILDETPTRGNIKISVDESYTLLIEAEKYTFEALYQYAKINVNYKNEVDVINDFINDSVRFIILNRKLTTDQENYLKSKQIIVRTTKVAYDALAFIVNKQNPDSNIRFDQLKDIFQGKINTWKKINSNSELRKITVVFDNEKSGNVRYLKDKFEIGNSFPDYCFAVNNNNDVISYVEKNKEAIGVISVNWISDKHDSVTIGFLDIIRVASIGEIGNTDGTGSFYKPILGNIALNNYPFTRDVYAICRESFSGLGTGFASFIAGDQGQRIVKLSGLVPATMPIRIIEVKK